MMSAKTPQRTLAQLLCHFVLLKLLSVAKMTLGRKFLLSALAASQLASANARPLSDVELKEFYGYKYVDGPSRKLPVPLDATETLKSAAERAGIYVAAAINYNGMTGGIGPEYPAIALSQFSGFTAENECKVSETQPAPGTYTYDQCTYIVQQAINNGSMYREFRNTYQVQSVYHYLPATFVYNCRSRPVRVVADIHRRPGHAHGNNAGLT